MKTRDVLLWQIAILLILLVLWEWFAGLSSQNAFLYGSPSGIAEVFKTKILDKSLFYDTFVTLSEAIIGFIIGNFLGLIIAMGLWYYNLVFRIAKPYIIVLGSIPLVALAPLMIIWFGIGMVSKVALVVLSTFVLTLVQAYKGAQEVDDEQIKMLRSFGANKNQIFSTVIFPSSLTWVISAFKINIGVALLGAFIGEFISSRVGLGHFIIFASGLYDISGVFVGVIMIAVCALILTYIVEKLEEYLTPWKVR